MPPVPDRDCLTVNNTKTFNHVPHHTDAAFFSTHLIRPPHAAYQFARMFFVQGLTMSTVNDVLRVKGNTVHCVDASATVLGAVRSMNLNRVGAVVVTDRGEMVGIFTERDVMTRVVAREVDPREMLVREVMTAHVACCTPETELDAIAEIMQRQRIRHLPVKDAQERLLGMVSIGDINAYHVASKQAVIEDLSGYIHGRS